MSDPTVMGVEAISRRIVLSERAGTLILSLPKSSCAHFKTKGTCMITYIYWVERINTSVRLRLLSLHD